MAGPVRSHRRAHPVSTALFFGGFLIGLFLLVLVARVGLIALGEQTGFVGVLVLFAGWISVLAVRARLRARREGRAAADLAHWEQTAGWEPTAWRWPWQSLVRWPDTVTVLRAYQKQQVRVGELTFDDNGLGDTVDRRAGRAAFAIVTLPHPHPSMAVRARRNAPKVQEREGAFEYRFLTLGPTEISPALRAAHLADEVPPWTVTGDELFVFVPLDGPLRPHDLEEAARRAQLVVSHLDR